MIISFLHIPLPPMVQECMIENKEINEASLIKKFYSFLENEIEQIHLKKALSQVEDLKN
jgi:hypothetical protein